MALRELLVERFRASFKKRWTSAARKPGKPALVSACLFESQGLDQA
jgi:hypothetical protein